MEWRLLAGVPPEGVRELLALARRRTFRRREVVFHRGDPSDSLHLIVKGRFAIRVTTPVGETATIAVRGAGESFGEMGVFDGGRRSATVRALEDSETFCLYETEFHRVRRDHPKVSDALIAFLTNEVRVLDERLLEALYVSVEQRVRRRLVELAGLYAKWGESTVEIPLTQEDLAELAGTSRATVNRVLREEQDAGTLERRRGRTVIVDRDRLAAKVR